MVRRSMTSPPRTTREAERHVNTRTLVIASVASATAAVVTSRLWIAGTWIAAAVTPVLVTLLSELLRRPTERIARGLTTDREALPDPDAPARRTAQRLRGPDELVPDPEVRVYRSRSAPPPGRKRQIAYRVVLVTAALAFVIGTAALTVPELIAGSSFGNNNRRTTLGGGSSKSKSKAPANAAPTSTETDTQTTQTETTTTTQTQTETVAPAPQSETTTTTSTTQTAP
jgi:hypothetical protein